LDLQETGYEWIHLPQGRDLFKAGEGFWRTRAQIAYKFRRNPLACPWEF